MRSTRRQRVLLERRALGREPTARTFHSRDTSERDRSAACHASSSFLRAGSRETCRRILSWSSTGSLCERWACWSSPGRTGGGSARDALRRWSARPTPSHRAVPTHESERAAHGLDEAEASDGDEEGLARASGWWSGGLKRRASRPSALTLSAAAGPCGAQQQARPTRRRWRPPALAARQPSFCTCRPQPSRSDQAALIDQTRRRRCRPSPCARRRRRCRTGSRAGPDGARRPSRRRRRRRPTLSGWARRPTGGLRPAGGGAGGWRGARAGAIGCLGEEGRRGARRGGGRQRRAAAGDKEGRRRTSRVALAEDAVAADDLAHDVAHAVDDERRLVLVRVVLDRARAGDRDELGLRERRRELLERALEVLACGLAVTAAEGREGIAHVRGGASKGRMGKGERRTRLCTGRRRCRCPSCRPRTRRRRPRRGRRSPHPTQARAPGCRPSPRATSRRG